MSAIFAATILGDLGTLVAQAIFAFVLLLVAIWGQISYGNRALKMGQDMVFGFFAVFVWFIGMSQLISGHISGLALVVITILMGTALIDPIRRATWARVLPIVADDRMHMLGLVCLLFAAGIFFLTSASVAVPLDTPAQLAQIVPTGGLLYTAGEAVVLGVLAVLLVGVGVRRVPRPAVAKATPVGAVAGGRGASNRGVIASSLDDAGEKMQYGTSFRWRRDPAAIPGRLGLTAPTPRVLLVALAAVAALVAVTLGGQRLTAALSPTIATNVARIAAEAQANVGGAAAAAVAAILLAIGEELLFRGAIQPRYGVFLTALAFAGLHTQYGFAVAPLTLFAVGLVLGLARRYGSTTAAILANVCYVVVMLALVHAGIYVG